MKKLLLGLLLTVGVSGYSFANLIDKNILENSYQTKTELTTIEDSNGNIDKKIYVTYNYKGDILVSCTIATHTAVYDTCGNLTGYWRESYEASGAACAGIEGGIKITLRRMMSGFGDCPASY